MFTHYTANIKNLLSEAEINKYISNYGNNKDNSKAVQPDASMGRGKRGLKGKIFHFWHWLLNNLDFNNA